jgi:hypothetical protein
MMGPTGEGGGAVSAGREASTLGTNIVALHRLHWYWRRAVNTRIHQERGMRSRCSSPHEHAVSLMAIPSGRATAARLLRERVSNRSLSGR